jgi:hypothetical protein
MLRALVSCNASLDSRPGMLGSKGLGEDLDVVLVHDVPGTISAQHLGANVVRFKHCG